MVAQIRQLQLASYKLWLQTRPSKKQRALHVDFALLEEMSSGESEKPEVTAEGESAISSGVAGGGIPKAVFVVSRLPIEGRLA